MNNDLNNVKISVILDINQGPKGAIPCVVGRDLKFSTKVLEAYRFRPLTPEIHDLMLLAGAVSFADSLVTRKTSKGWSRYFEIYLPVYNPGFWCQGKILSSLRNVLEPLTGDFWHFNFLQRNNTCPASSQILFEMDEGPITVIPYSDGLDSFAVARLQANLLVEESFFLVTTGNHKNADREWEENRLDGRKRRVSIPFSVPKKTESYRLRENSCRSRAFVFGIMAGIAAYLCKSNRIVIPESGQGSLGPSLAPVGFEVADTRAHPKFSRRLAEFLNYSLEWEIKIEHPQLWKTKGETLKELRNLSLENNWAGTMSCPRKRHMNLNGRKVHCGICSSCLLRRQSLLASDLGGNSEPYIWDKVSDILYSTNSTRGNNQCSEHAKIGVLSLHQLACLLDSNQIGENSIQLESMELPEILGESFEEVEEKIHRLILTHKAEWNHFAESQGFDFSNPTMKSGQRR